MALTPECKQKEERSGWWWTEMKRPGEARESPLDQKHTNGEKQEGVRQWRGNSRQHQSHSRRGGRSRDNVKRNTQAHARRAKRCSSTRNVRSELFYHKGKQG